MKPKVNWKDARKEYPPFGFHWTAKNGSVDMRSLMTERDRLAITHWAEIEYPEPPEEEKMSISELSKFLAELCSTNDEIKTASATARKLIEVMEERGYDHPHRAAGIDYNQGYIDGRQETINYIKRWCGEV